LGKKKIHCSAPNNTNHGGKKVMHSAFFFFKKRNILDNPLFFLESVWENNVNHIPLNFDFFYLK
jgi:hypothetical protein